MVRSKHWWRERSQRLVVSISSSTPQPNRGDRHRAEAGRITDDLFWDDVNVKVMGYLRMAREAAPHMAAAGWGRIINISGLAARQTGSIIGSIRNVAVSALTKNLADELGPKGINVTVVHPGLTRTEKTAPLVAARAASDGVAPEEIERRLAANVTIGRLVDMGGSRRRRGLPCLASKHCHQRRRHCLRGRSERGDTLLSQAARPFSNAASQATPGHTRPIELVWNTLFFSPKAGIRTNIHWT
jgi:NAD(P)-dependent dehydrogenase (short-subunit alcohol dehydrogenase family)